MILIVGLGNPGPEYERTPHNAGFRAIEALKARVAPDALWQPRRESTVLETTIEGTDVTLCKPLTFMNNSGGVVAHMMDYSPIKLGDLWVAHDDLDIPRGRAKVDTDRSSAGHKGVQSIIDALGSQSFWRARIGVEPDFIADKQDLDSYLTAKPLSSIAQQQEDALLQKLVTELLTFVKNGIRKTTVRT